MNTLGSGEYKFDESKYKPISNLKAADFCLIDGEGVILEAYFFKILKRNHKPKSIKIIGCLTALDESAYELDLQKAMNDQIEFCNQCEVFPMKFFREKVLKEKLDNFRYKQNMPFVYKGIGARLYYGDTGYDMRFTYTDDYYDNEKTIITLAWAAALELMARSGEIDETDYPDYLKITD